MNKYLQKSNFLLFAETLIFYTLNVALVIQSNFKRVKKLKWNFKNTFFHIVFFYFILKLFVRKCSCSSFIEESENCIKMKMQFNIYFKCFKICSVFSFFWIAWERCVKSVYLGSHFCRQWQNTRAWIAWYLVKEMFH